MKLSNSPSENDDAPNPFLSSSASSTPPPVAPKNAPAPNAPASSTAREIFAANAQDNSAAALRAERSRLVASSYRPSGRIGTAGFPLLLVWPILVGALGGYVFWISNWHTLLVSQIVLGFALGFTMFPAIYFGKVRNPRAAATSAVFAALVALLCWHAMAAKELRDEYIGYFTKLAVQAKVPPSQARARISGMLTPYRTARLYAQDRTAYGVTLTSDSDSRSGGSGGTRIVGAWYWLLAFFEFAMTALMAAILAMAWATKRFSEERDRWYRRKLMANVNSAQAMSVLEMLQSGQWSQAGNLARSAKSKEGFALTIYDCPPQSDGVVTMTTSAGNNQTHHLFEAEVPAENIARLRGENV